VRDTDKAAALLWLLREGLPKKSPTLVFASTRHHVDFLTLLLSLEGVEVCAVHGTMDQVGVSCGTALVWHCVGGGQAAGGDVDLARRLSL
jgi:hypothetical protein